MDRTQLFDTLSNLPPAAFERLLVAVNMPRMNRAGASAKIGEQVSALLEWADSSIGPGVEAIARHLAELDRFEFDAYLRSLVATYEKWWEHYTLTDATGKLEQPKPEQPSVFDFRLMVQTVANEKDAPSPELRSEEREKTERLPVLDGIRKYADDHVLLVGRPGSGKSTALIKLVLDVADQTLKDGHGQIPILVELRYWQTSVIERIQAFLNRHDPSLSLEEAALSALLRQGRFLLLIDGLNELPSDEARTQLSSFRRDYPQAPMIFTTRDLGLGGDLGIEKKLEMQPLTEAQMKSFIRAYVPDQAEAMLRQLSDRLREFGQTPLLLWMLCEVFQRSPNRQMPTNLAEVFRAFTTMYEDSSVRKHEVALLKGDVRPLSDRRLWKDALKALAALMMQGETPVDFRVAIHRTEAERELGKIFANEKFPVRDILDDLLKYHLLQNRTTDQLEFRHQLIQEYYAAEHLLVLLPELSDEQLKRDYLNLLKWTEAIALMLALVSDEGQALRVLKLAVNDVDIIFALNLSKNIKTVFRPSIVEWIENLEIAKIFRIRFWGATQNEESIPELVQAIKDEHLNDETRKAAIYALGEIGSNSAAIALSRFLYRGLSFYSHANIALEEIGSETAIMLLSNTPRRPLVRHPFLIKRIEERSRQEDYGKPQESQTLFKHAASLEGLSSPSLKVRQESAELLGKNADEESIQGLIGSLERCEAAITELIKALDDSDPNVCNRVNKELDNIGWEKIVRLLIKALRCPCFKVHVIAAYELRIINTETTISALIEATKDSYSGIRANAVYELGELHSEEMIEVLASALDDSDYEVRLEAVRALGKINDSKTVIPLIKVLKDGCDRNIEGRASAAFALGEIGGGKGVKALTEALGDPFLEVRISAARALVKAGDEDVLPKLLESLERETEVDGFGYLAEEVAKVGRPSEIPLLVEAFNRYPEIWGVEVAVSVIQERFGFYNYEIWQAHLANQRVDSSASQSDKATANTITIQSVEKLTIMSDKAPIFNQQHATIGVNYAAEGSQQDFTQHIHAPEQSFEILLTSYKHFIDELQQQNPHVTDETAIIQTIDTEARRIDTHWQNFLNLKRLWNGGKKAAIKVGEHFVESNPWGKGAIAFLEGSAKM